MPLSHVQVLAMLDHRGSLSITEISNSFGIAKPNITPLVDRLIEDGLVMRERNSADRRVVNVVICEKGRERLADIYRRPVRQPLRLDAHAQPGRTSTAFNAALWRPSSALLRKQPDKVNQNCGLCVNVMIGYKDKRLMIHVIWRDDICATVTALARPGRASARLRGGAGRLRPRRTMTAVAAQTAPDLSVNISVPYATTTPTRRAGGSGSALCAGRQRQRDGAQRPLDRRGLRRRRQQRRGADSTDGYTPSCASATRGRACSTLQTAPARTGLLPPATSPACSTRSPSRPCSCSSSPTAPCRRASPPPTCSSCSLPRTAPAYSAQAYAAAVNGGSFTDLQLGASGSSVLALQAAPARTGLPRSPTSPATTTRRPPRR